MTFSCPMKPSMAMRLIVISTKKGYPIEVKRIGREASRLEIPDDKLQVAVDRWDLLRDELFDLKVRWGDATHFARNIRERCDHRLSELESPRSLIARSKKGDDDG